MSGAQETNRVWGASALLALQSHIPNTSKCYGKAMGSRPGHPTAESQTLPLQLEDWFSPTSSSCHMLLFGNGNECVTQKSLEILWQGSSAFPLPSLIFKTVAVVVEEIWKYMSNAWDLRHSWQVLHIKQDSTHRDRQHCHKQEENEEISYQEALNTQHWRARVTGVQAD